MDERGHVAADQVDSLEHILLSGLGKRSGRAFIISTSAANDAHPFSVWLDQEQDGVYRQEHRPPPGLPVDNLDSLIEANPGASQGIGQSLNWLQAQARRAVSRGGSKFASFRLYNRNERVSDETRDVLLTVAPPNRPLTGCRRAPKVNLWWRRCGDSGAASERRRDHPTTPFL